MPFTVSHHVGLMLTNGSALTVVSPRLDENSWPFVNVDPFPGAQVDPINNAERMRDVYLTAEPNYGGR